MANSRKSPPLNKSPLLLDAVFQRALKDILARVVVSDRIASRTAFRIAVAFSGGLDSTVLLHLAAAACKPRGIQLFAFHVHHGLSPNADQWLAHCEEQAQQANATFVARQVQINPHDKLGIEQAARLARYDALADMCIANDVPLLLTAHHQDDQAETVVLQLLRGAGLPGLSAMAMLQPEHALLGAGIGLGRPLLEMTRADLELWADTNAIKHIVDESNDDLRFRRNEVRHQLMPLLEQQLPGVQKSIARSARHLQVAQRLLDELAAMDLQSCGDADSLVIERLRQLSDDRLDNLLRYWLKQCGADHYPSDAQLYQLREQMLHARDDAHPLLVLCGLVLERHAGNLVARHDEPLPINLPSEILLHWQGESEIAIPAWQGRLVFETAVGPGLDRAQLFQGPLRLRPRGGGERLKLDANRPSRTLKNLFQESDVPARERLWLPLLYLGDELIFAAGLGMDVRAGRTSEGVRLRWQRQD
jgi:tRNA(Ile)-lysidine synthase